MELFLHLRRIMLHLRRIVQQNASVAAQFVDIIDEFCCKWSYHLLFGTLPLPLGPQGPAK